MALKGPEAALRKLREGELEHKLKPAYKYRSVSYLIQCGRTQEALLELEEALMADHQAHKELLAHYPPVLELPQVMHLIELYQR